MDHPNKQVFLPGIGEELNIPLAAVVADHGKAGNAVGLTVVIQNIRESPVHLVGFTGLCDVPAATISLRRNHLASGRNQVFVRSNILFYNGRPSFKTSLFQTLQYDRGILTALTQQAVQQASITAKFCDLMSTAFGAARLVLKDDSLESAQSATRYAGSAF